MHIRRLRKNRMHLYFKDENKFGSICSKPYSSACGVAALEIVIIRMPNPKVHLPPNLCANNPPGMCETRYPMKNADRTHPCSS